MILSGQAIIHARERGDLLLEPFDVAGVNPNSYNYHLGPTIIEIDQERSIREEAEIPRVGIVLLPGRLYLGSTHERIGSEKLVITLLGRSSVGRLGLYLNVTADIGHIGSDLRWTMLAPEIEAVAKVDFGP